MRAIINMASGRAAAATGWRAREIKVAQAGATLGEILRATPLVEGKGTLYDLVTDEDGLRSDFSLFISGEFLQGDVDLRRPIRDNEQIHLWDWPFSTRDS
jgi:hypothetical protein